MLKVGLLLGAAKSLTALCLRLVVALFVALGGNTGTLSDVLGDALGLGLLSSGSSGGGLCLSSGSLGRLLTLYLRVLGSIPRVKYLYIFDGKSETESKKLLA